MIYTITMNPALDRTIWVKSLASDDANRIDKEARYAGGKGIDVSKVLTHLGLPNRALGFLGGYAGMEVEGILLADGIVCDFTPIANETRTNIVLDVEEGEQQILLSARGPVVKSVELTSFFKKIEQLESPDFVAIGGSLPQGLSPIVYARCIEVLRNSGARVLLDTDGDNLREGITGRPHVIKPNIHELSRLVGRELTEMVDVLDAAREVHRTGIETVLVSMGGRGIILAGADERYHATPPAVKVINTIGAGDSAVAGFIYAQSKGLDLQESLKFAVAAGTAATLQAGTALAHLEEVERLVTKVHIERV